jgi:hypothetical protein
MCRNPRAGNPPRRRRRASLTVELLLVAPIVLAVLLGTVEFSLLSVARQQVQAASREGARVAALGGTAAEVELAVRRFLGAGPYGAAEVDVVVSDAFGNPIPSGEPVAVGVRLPAAAAVPDLLPFAGLSLRGETLAALTTMRKE